MASDDEELFEPAQDDQLEDVSFWSLKISESSKNNQFTYTPLQAGEIRLLVLLPQSAGYPICCELKVVSLTEKPLYEALSYTWGPAETLTTIPVNNQSVAVRHNLWLALSHLRDLEKPRVLWVDALCINQGSNEERSIQVSMMGDIYRSASKVLVWLGDGDAGSDDAFESIEIIAKIIRDRKSNKETNIPRKANGEEILSLCYRDYWSRIWIIQELRAASVIELYCGSRSMPWNIFVRVVGDKHLWKLPDTLWKPLTGTKGELGDAIAFSPAGIIVRQRPSFSNTLKDLLYRHRKSECEDCRDKIYGLLGLSTDCHQGEIKADYSKQATQLYFDVMAHCTDPSRSTEASNRDIVRFSQLLLQFLRNPFRSDEHKRYREKSIIDNSTFRSNPAIYSIPAQTVGIFICLGPPIHKGETSISADSWYLNLRNPNSPFAPLLTKPKFYEPNHTRFVDIFCDIIFTLDDQTYERILGSRFISNEMQPVEETVLVDRKGFLFYTSFGELGLASCPIEKGDQICRISSCNVMALVRPNHRDPSGFDVIGRVIVIERYKQLPSSREKGWKQDPSSREIAFNGSPRWNEIYDCFCSLGVFDHESVQDISLRINNEMAFYLTV